MKSAIIAVAAACILSASPLFAAPAMEPGQWEITIKMEMPGMPFAMPPMVHRQCFTKSDVKDTKKTLPSSSKKKDDCAVKDMKMKGNKATWRVQCKDGTKGTGEIEYHRTSYRGVMKMESAGGEGPSKMVQHISAKRVGNCK